MNLKVYGLTQDTTTNEYMLVFDELGPKRRAIYGVCASCYRYNTSEAWCQTCDPQKTTQGWTSGNKEVDNCIQEFQLKATGYDDVIEWIPFNRLENLHNTGDKLLATWLDGVRRINDIGDKHYRMVKAWLDGARHLNEVEDKYECSTAYIQSRTQSCVVELKT